jgi:ribosomal protein S27E
MIEAKFTVELKVQCSKCNNKITVIGDDWVMNELVCLPLGWTSRNRCYGYHDPIVQTYPDIFGINAGPVDLLCPTCSNIKDILE